MEILSKTEKFLPTDFQNGLLSIFKIQSFNLKNTEILGIPDPYIRVRVGTYAEKTYTIQNGGCDALFEPLDMKLPVTAGTLRLNKIEFEVWDETLWQSRRAVWLAKEASGEDALPEEMKTFSL